MKISKAIEGYLLDYALGHSQATVKMYQLYLRIMAAFLDDKEIKSVTQDDLKRYLLYLKTDYQPHRLATSTRKNAPLSPAACDNHWKCMRSFYGWAAANLKIKNPASNLPRAKFERPTITPYTQDEINRLIHAAEWVKEKRGERTINRKRPTAKRDRAIILILLDTGMRVGELSRLHISDVHLDASEIYIEPYGTGRKTKSRIAPIGKSTKLAIWHYLSAIKDFDPGQSLFGMSTGYIRQTLMKVGASAAVPNTHPHKFRHTFALEYLRNGGDIYTLRKILGHATLDMVEHYLNLVQADVETAHRRASPADHWKL